MATEDEIAIVIAKIESLPPHIKIAIGGTGSFDKWQLIEHVKKQDEIGSTILNVFMSDLRSFKRRSETVASTNNVT